MDIQNTEDGTTTPSSNSNQESAHPFAQNPDAAPDTRIRDASSILPTFVSGRIIFQEMEASDESLAQAYLKRMVREIVEALLSEMIDIESFVICGVKRHTRGGARKDWRISSYSRNIRTGVGLINLRMPVFRLLTLPKIVVENYIDNEASINAMLANMYLRGGSASQLAEIISNLWGARPVPEDIAQLNKDVAWKIEVMRNSALENNISRENIQFVPLEIKGSMVGASTETVRIWAAIDTRTPAQRKIIALSHAAADNPGSWQSFRDWLAVRGLTEAGHIVLPALPA